MTEAGGGTTGGRAAPLERTGTPVAQVQAKVTDLVRERPEVAVAGAFAGGLIAALIVRRLGS